MPLSDSSCSPPRWPGLPTPHEPNATWPGRAFAAAIRSAIDLSFESLATATRNGVRNQRHHWLEGLQRLEAARLVEVGQRRQVFAVELQQRVAVGGGSLDRFDRDEAGAARLVLDQHT